MQIGTLNRVFYSVVERNAAAAMLTRRGLDWQRISSQELYRDVLGVARALTGWGVNKGDRVAILSESRPEWAIADFAAMLLGAVTVPIYPTLTPEQMVHMIADSGPGAIFVSTGEQLRKIIAIKHDTALEKIIVMDEVESRDAVSMQQLMRQGPAERDAKFDANAQSIGPDDLATIIYTSGTTGTPKGVMLTHGNLGSNLSCSLELFEFPSNWVSISYLPLSHITARHLDYAMFWRGVTVAYCPFIDELLKSLLQARPQVFVGVPRVYEKIHQQVLSQTGKGLKRKVFDWAMRIGRAHKDEVLAGSAPRSPGWTIANRLVFSKVKQALGGRTQVFISGGAPLNRDLIDWYGGIGIRVYEGYGLTETSPVIALNNPTDYRAGSVGKPLRNVEVRIAKDGEILVRGPSIFKGYWKLPTETAQAFDGDWFRTGDIGRLDEDGFLYITDRKKDLIKTSGGKFITPQPIEAKLKANPLVAEAAVIGERRKFPSVILAPNFTALEEWAEPNNVVHRNREELISNPRVQALYKGIVEEVNRDLAHFEQLKKFVLIPDELSIANGSLTPTLKLRRRIMEERYRRQLDELYAE